MANHSRTAKLA